MKEPGEREYDAVVTAKEQVRDRRSKTKALGLAKKELVFMRVPAQGIGYVWAVARAITWGKVWINAYIIRCDRRPGYIDQTIVVDNSCAKPVKFDPKVHRPILDADKAAYESETE